MLEPEAPRVPVAPQAIYHSRVDDKGRLRLNRELEAYLRSFPEQVFFVTTLDERIARIYPIATWLQNSRFFEECQEEPEAVEAVAFFTRVYGAESALDHDGRILIPPQLRRKLGIENQPVWVGYFKGALEVYSEAVYEETMQRASEKAKEQVGTLRKLGLK